MVCTANVFADRRPRAGGDARPYNTIGTGAKCMRTNERIVTHDMLARWSIKYLRFPLSHGRVVEDADPYGW